MLRLTALPYSTLPFPPPALQPPIALPIFSRPSAVGSRPRIKPLLEMRLEALEHLFFYVFDVGEQVPTSDIAVFTGALKLQNEFFPHPPLAPVFFPEMLLANVRRLFLPVLGIPNPILCAELPPPIMLETFSC